MKTMFFYTLAVFGWMTMQLQQPVFDPQQLAPAEAFVRIDDLDIHYVHAGQGDPVLLIHGFGGWLVDWENTIPALARTHEVYALDLPGWGFSDKPEAFDYSIPSQAAFVLKFLDHFGLERVDLVGNSMGGAISTYIALESPERVRKLVLVDSAGFRDFHLDILGNSVGQLPFASELVRFFLPEFHRVRYTMERFLGVDITPQEVEAHYLPLRTQGMAKALVAMSKTLHLDSIRDRIKDVRHPTLILWGARDPLMLVEDAYKFEAAIEGSKLKVYPKAGHVPQHDVAEQVNPLLLEFLK